MFDTSQAFFKYPFLAYGTDQGIQIAKKYNTTNDIYGIGQFSNGRQRMITSSNYSEASNNLSYAVDDSTAKYYDVLRMKYNRVSILSTPPNANTLTYAEIAAGTYATQGQLIEPIFGNNDAGLTINNQRRLTFSGTNAYSSVYTQSRNIYNGSNCNLMDDWIYDFQLYANNSGGKVSDQVRLRHYLDFANNDYAPFEIIHNPWFNNNAFYFNFSSYVTHNGGAPFGYVKLPTTARNATDYYLIIAGDGTLYTGNTYSDSRLKKDVRTYSNSILDEYRKIDIKNYKWRDDDEFTKKYAQTMPQIKPGEENIGFIAQEILEKCPTIQRDFSLIGTYGWSDDMPKGTSASQGKKECDNNYKPSEYFYEINDKNFNYLHIKAIQETNLRLDDVEKKINNMGSVEVENLRLENEALKARIANLEIQLTDLLKLLKSKYII